MTVTAPPRSSRQRDAARELLRVAQALAAAGVPQATAGAELAANAPDRAALQEAQLELVHRMHQLPSWDLAATSTLRLIERALRLIPHDGAPSALCSCQR